jgi:hypothetical protein
MPVVETNHRDPRSSVAVADASSESVEQQAIPGTPAASAAPKQFFVSRKNMDFGEKNSKTLLTAGAIGAVAVVGGLLAFTSKHTPGGQQRPAQPPASVQQVVRRKPSAGIAMPGDKAAEQARKDAGDDQLSANDIENTANKTSNVGPGSAQGSLGKQGQFGQTGNRPQKFGASPAQLSQVPQFEPPQYAGQPYAAVGPTSSYSAEQLREAKEAVSKASIVFVQQNASRGAQSSAAAQEPVTNFGLEPGFHVAAHLESSASTVGGSPAVAIIEYDYTRDGKVLIPAGSRAVGKIQAASSTGLVSLTFTEIYMPDGTRIPISAVGLDDKLHMLKGKVTGKNTGKQLMLAALTGVGTIGATFAMPNSNQTISQQQLAEQQMVSNSGRGVDQVVQQMEVSQRIVVTVAAGVQMFVTFVAPQRSLTP